MRGAFSGEIILFPICVKQMYIFSYPHTGFSSYKIDLLLKSFIKSVFAFAVGNKQKVKVKRSCIKYYIHQDNYIRVLNSSQINDKTVRLNHSSLYFIAL